MVTGSPTKLNSAKAMKPTTSITGMACSRREMMKASTRVYRSGAVIGHERSYRGSDHAEASIRGHSLMSSECARRRIPARLSFRHLLRAPLRRAIAFGPAARGIRLPPIRIARGDRRRSSRINTDYTDQAADYTEPKPDLPLCSVNVGSRHGKNTLRVIRVILACSSVLAPMAEGKATQPRPPRRSHAVTCICESPD